MTVDEKYVVCRDMNVAKAAGYHYYRLSAYDGNYMKQ